MSEQQERRPHPMMRVSEKFERVVVVALLVMMMVAIVFASVDLGRTLVAELVSPPRLLFEVDQIMDIFGLVFMILIGLELLETIKTYLSKEQLHVEIVFLVAMIAVARKVIVLEIKEYDPVVLLGIAAIILALAVGFYFVKLAYRRSREEAPPRRGPGF
ncbi:MAG: phosphate-starvation-inducible PsiE family protein [Candidatus Brocadiia bacterium]